MSARYVDPVENCAIAQKHDDSEQNLVALAALRDHGAHLVAFSQDKRPQVTGWLKRKPNFDTILSHAKAGGLVGIVPQSVSLVAVDLDRGDAETVVDLLGEPLAIVKTRRQGGRHLYYRAPTAESIGNQGWQIGDSGGEVRGARGSCVLWDAAAVAAALDKLNDAPVVDLSRLPKPESRKSVRGQAAVATAPKGTRNDTLNAEVFRAAKTGSVDKPAFREAGLQSGLSPAEVHATIASAALAGESTAKPRLPYGPNGLRAALDGLGISVRYNVRAHRAEWREAGDWRQFDDRSRRDIRSRIEAAYQNAKGDNPLRFGRERFGDDLNGVLYHCEVDAFCEFLEALPAWDGVCRLDAWIDECFRLHESGSMLSKWASRFILLGAVWRTYCPGTKLDETPVLIGPKGCGKSTAVAGVLPPPNREDWFNDQLHLAADPKTRVEAFAGPGDR